MKYLRSETRHSIKIVKLLKLIWIVSTIKLKAEAPSYIKAFLNKKAVFLKANF